MDAQSLGRTETSRESARTAQRNYTVGEPLGITILAGTRKARISWALKEIFTTEGTEESERG
jgi:hypothetical protein